MSARLPEKQYYRAGTLGEGAYGAVSVVYDDDGNEFAAKTFWEESAGGDEGGDWNDDGEWEEASAEGIECGVLREIAMLRLLNGAHPNLMSLHDVSRMDKDALALVLPKAGGGSLTGAMEKQTLTNKDKVKVAALSLHALAFMHSHGIIHRDLKPDNILLSESGDPIVADFSLAKVVGAKAAAISAADGKQTSKRPSKKAGGKKRKQGDEDGENAAPVLTSSMGTPTYTAPEIVNGESYGVKADVFSMGVVLLELFHGSALEAWKDKHALAQLEEIKKKLSDKPIPALLKAMLEFDPEQRVSAAEALAMLPGVDKVCALPTSGELHLPAAEATAAAADAPKGGAQKPAKRAKTSGKDASADSLTPARICKLIETANPQTAQDAEHLFRRSEPAREAGQVGMAACALIACKISETEMWKPDDICEYIPALESVFDPEAYPALELEILASVGYSVISCTATTCAPLGEIQVA